MFHSFKQKKNAKSLFIFHKQLIFYWNLQSSFYLSIYKGYKIQLIQILLHICVFIAQENALMISF